MKKTKIDWCDATWNPVTGCLHGCEYCYARGIAGRFGSATTDSNLHVLDRPYRWNDIDCAHGFSVLGRVDPYPFGFAPTIHRHRLGEPARWTKPRTIFVCSMADLFGSWVPDGWIHEVLDACYAAPQHKYLFLTKNPERYGDVVEYLETVVKDCSPEPPQIWLGASATDNAQLDRAYGTAATWLSIEPLREELLTDMNFVGFRPHDGSEYGRWGWVVIGAETGNHKNKVVPEREWVLEIAKECAQWGTAVFMKESLRTLMGPDFRQEYPWETRA